MKLSLEPAITRHDEQTQQLARDFSMFFKNEIDLPELKKRLEERKNDMD